jgi:hypothetical protein
VPIHGFIKEDEKSENRVTKAWDNIQEKKNKF